MTQLLCLHRIDSVTSKAQQLFKDCSLTQVAIPTTTSQKLHDAQSVVAFSRGPGDTPHRAGATTTLFFPDLPEEYSVAWLASQIGSKCTPKSGTKIVAFPVAEPSTMTFTLAPGETRILPLALASAQTWRIDTLMGRSKISQFIANESVFSERTLRRHDSEANSGQEMTWVSVHESRTNFPVGAEPAIVIFSSTSNKTESFAIASYSPSSTWLAPAESSRYFEPGDVSTLPLSRDSESVAYFFVPTPGSVVFLASLSSAVNPTVVYGPDSRLSSLTFSNSPSVMNSARVKFTASRAGVYGVGLKRADYIEGLSTTVVNANIVLSLPTPTLVTKPIEPQKK